MDKPILVIKVKVTQFNALLNLMLRVIAHMTGNLNFTTPSPALATVSAAAANLENAIRTWGTTGHRGSHDDYVNLQAQAILSHTLVCQLADYCMTAVNPSLPYAEQSSVLASSGFLLKDARTSQGVLEMVQNFHRFISRSVAQDQVKLKWAKPLNVSNSINVHGYKIYRHSVNNFQEARLIDAVKITSYIDNPGAGAWYYWVVPYNKNGNGVTSTVVFAILPAW